MVALSFIVLFLILWAVGLALAVTMGRRARVHEAEIPRLREQSYSGVVVSRTEDAARNARSAARAMLTAAIAAALCAVAVWVGNSVHVIGAREVGVQLRFGAIQQNTLEPGFHWTAPWTNVETVTTVPQTDTVKPQVRSAQNGRIAPTLLVRWRVTPQNAADLYTQIRNSKVDGDTEDKIFTQLVNPSLSGAAGAALGKKENLEIVNGQNWPGNASAIELIAAPDLARTGITLQSVRQTAAAPDPDTERAIQRSAAQQVETSIAETAKGTATAQAARNLTEANGLRTAADRFKGLTPEQVNLLCLQAGERIMNKNNERGLPTYTLPCQTGGGVLAAAK